MPTKLVLPTNASDSRKLEDNAASVASTVRNLRCTACESHKKVPLHDSFAPRGCGASRMRPLATHMRSDVGRATSLSPIRSCLARVARNSRRPGHNIVLGGQS
eukprot:15433600-Alexandrium_andersonii.AAC.4